MTETAHEGRHEHRVTVTVVVSGVPVVLQTLGQEHVSTLVRQALEETGNHGQAPDGWELRTETGQLIPQHETVHHAGIHAGATLFLSPEAGVGGCR